MAASSAPATSTATAGPSSPCSSPAASSQSRGGPVTRPDVLFAKAGAGAVVDLDGDGQLEILAGTGDALHIGRRELDGRTTFVRHDLELKGLSGIVTADFDGDGLLDLGLRSGAGVAIVRQRP
ncbi:FG-GAP-like repeat-containing protein [Nannocystis pusilla]|uniref:FG-GAP-like repeat-containing protein n=1 Tax=Nannocystis pusilla TaxID=889268 RepID=UPI003B79BEE9